MSESTPSTRGMEFYRLEQISMQRIAEWDLTSRERLLAGWIVRLSFGRGRDACLVPTLAHFRRVTGLDEADVCRGLQGLAAAGVLQVSGSRRGPRRYTFLPNALLVEPDRVVDPEDAARCLAELEEINALGPGFEPGGQRRLEVVTSDERVDERFAQASRELAVERQDAVESRFGDEWVKRMTRCSLERSGTIAPGEVIGDSPIENESAGAKRDDLVIFSPRFARSHEIPGGSIGDLPISRNRDAAVIGKSPTMQRAVTPPRVGAGDVYHVNDNTNNVRDVGCLPLNDEDVRYALDLIEQVIPASDFAPWRRKWETRCRLAPKEIVEAVGDVKMYAQRQKVKCWGAAIFRRAQTFAAERGVMLS